MTDPNQPIAYPLLIRFARTGMMRFVGHLDWIALQQVMFLRAGFGIAIGEGPTRKLKLKFSPPTPVGVATRTEFTYLVLTERIYPEEAIRRLQEQCPDGIEVLTVMDAGYLLRKNPFGKIEATSYTVDFGEGVTEKNIADISEALENIAGGPVPEGLDPKDVKGFWGRILEIRQDNDVFELMCLQKEGDTFHAAKSAAFLLETLDLPHYPIYTKLEYLRLTPSRKKLFQARQG